MPIVGRVRKVFAERCYGFIHCSASNDIYFHSTALRDVVIGDLKERDVVAFDLETYEGRYRAYNVRKVDADEVKRLQAAGEV